MYKLIALISVLIRQFYLPNPFEPLRDRVAIDMMGVSVPITPEIINWCAEGLIHFITFQIVGLYYTRRVDDPAKGSLLYLFFYVVHVGAIYLMSLFAFAPWAVIAVIVLYVAMHIGLNKFTNKFIRGGI